MAINNGIKVNIEIKQNKSKSLTQIFTNVKKGKQNNRSLVASIYQS